MLPSSKICWESHCWHKWTLGDIEIKGWHGRALSSVYPKWLLFKLNCVLKKFKNCFSFENVIDFLLCDRKIWMPISSLSIITVLIIAFFSHRSVSESNLVAITHRIEKRNALPIGALCTDNFDCASYCCVFRTRLYGMCIAEPNIGDVKQILLMGFGSGCQKFCD